MSDQSPTENIEEPASFWKRIFTSPNKAIAEPEKEIRFTRSAQATVFLVAAVLCCALCICTLFCAFVNWGYTDYTFTNYWWVSLFPLIPAFILYRIGIHCIKHAYIILTPMGVELFPFWKPQKNLQVIFWSDIDHADVEGNLLKLHNDAEETGGTIISLKPIIRNQHHLLARAINGRLAKKDEPNQGV